MPLGAHKAAIMGVAGVSTGDVVLLSSQTGTGASSITFSSDITSTYGEYIFKFYNINPSSDGAFWSWQANGVGESGYNETITNSLFYTDHTEADDDTSFDYLADWDQAQGTAYANICTGVGNGTDESCAGELHLFNPASTTYVKHFYSRGNFYVGSNAASHQFFAGYINTTTAIDDVNFKMSAGTFDGKIKMWGVK